MDIIFSASIAASFLAGMVALFAPCCITVLLPAYLASAFRKKANILKMTFVFFAGIAVIIIPIGLGAASLAAVFKNYHREMYVFGGLFMLALGVMSILGKGLPMIPMPKRTAPKAGASHIKSVFVLGLFSGAATSCCAPVLAGAVTLAVISGVFWKALVVTFAYVFGMTLPLFVAAYFYDRFHLEDSKIIKGRVVRIKLGSKAFAAHSTNLLAGAVFFLMGVVLLVLAYSGNAFWSPAYQVSIGSYLNRLSISVFEAISFLPDFIWAAVIIGLFLYLLYRMKVWEK